MTISLAHLLIPNFLALLGTQGSVKISEANEEGRYKVILGSQLIGFLDAPEDSETIRYRGVVPGFKVAELGTMNLIYSHGEGRRDQWKNVPFP